MFQCKAIKTDGSVIYFDTKEKFELKRYFPHIKYLRSLYIPEGVTSVYVSEILISHLKLSSTVINCHATHVYLQRLNLEKANSLKVLSVNNNNLKELIVPKNLNYLICHNNSKSMCINIQSYDSIKDVSCDISATKSINMNKFIRDSSKRLFIR